MKKLIMMTLLIVLIQGCTHKLTAVSTNESAEFNASKAKVYFNNWQEAEEELKQVYETCDGFMLEGE